MGIDPVIGSLFGGSIGPLAGLLGDPLGRVWGDSLGQTTGTQNGLANQQVLWMEAQRRQQENLQKQMGLQSDPFHMQGVQLGGQGALHATSGLLQPIPEKIKPESPPWSQEMCVCLAMAVTAAVVYPAIKLILGVL